jgi:hypothetical protein
MRCETSSVVLTMQDKMAIVEAMGLASPKDLTAEEP